MGVPLNIDWQQILLHLFNFLILFGGLYLLLYRPVKAFMDKRTAYYADMDAEAKRKLADAERQEKQYRDHLANVENEADALKKQAMESARQAAAEQLRQAKEARRAILDRAQREAAQEKARVLAEAGTEIDALVAEAVDKLLPPSGKAPLDDFLDRVEKEEADMAAFRRDHLGFVFQDFNLLDTFTLEDNIYLPLVLAGKKYPEMHRTLVPLASELGIEKLLKKYPYEVSGGQKQRAAVARAMITRPRILLADEPTGALDSKSTDELLGLFSRLHADGQTILMVTHSVKAASHAGRVLFLKDGQVFHQLRRDGDTDARFYQRISDALTALTTGGDAQ